MPMRLKYFVFLALLHYVRFVNRDSSKKMGLEFGEKVFFLIKKGEFGTIQIFTVAYIPFFTLMSYYAISNIV